MLKNKKMKKGYLFTVTIILILVFLGSNCKPPPPEPPPPPKPVPTSVTDIDGNKYSVKRFGNTLWMAENLRVTKYDTASARSGIIIPESKINQTINRNEPYFVNPANFEESPYTDNFTNEIRNSLGFLYNWSAAAGAPNNGAMYQDSIQGICPNGWRLPRANDLNNLFEYLGGQEVAGLKLKSMYGWYPNIGCGNNESGMNCYPAGMAVTDTLITTPFIAMVGTHTMFWCARSIGVSILTSSGVLRLMSDKDAAESANITKYQANSVRCVLDIDDSFEQ